MRLLILAGNRAVAVADGRIVPAEGAFDLILHGPETEIRPGLINAHDHLHRNHYGRLGQPPYANAYRWADDIQQRYQRHIATHHALPRREALLAGAWKNLFAGVTAVVHHDAWEPDFERDFPLTVARIHSADSLGKSPDLTDLATGRPYCLHLAEGVDTDAADEVRMLARQGLLTRDLVAVHGLGMDEDAIAQFRAAGAALVWCPSSNLFLFDRTAPTSLLKGGIDLLLGSDSLLTGAGDLLDELRCARALGAVSDARLLQAVGIVAAYRLGLPEPSLEPGSPADFVLLGRPLLDASAEDVLLVMVGGTPRVARPDLGAKLDPWVPGGSSMRVGRVTRWTNMRAATAPSGSLES